MNAYTYPAPVVTGRAVVLAATVAAHLLLIWGLASGLARDMVKIVEIPFDVVPPDEPERPTDPPPPPPPDFARQRVIVPIPDVPNEWPDEGDPISAASEHPSVPESRSAVRTVLRVSPRLDVRRSPPTDDDYPVISRRMGEQGTTTVRACVGTDGRASRPEVEKSSGSARLDEAALKWARRARWSPGTEDGAAVETCDYRFNVVFRLAGGD